MLPGGSDFGYVDTTTLIALETIGELRVRADLGDPLVILPRVAAEVSTEPARTNLEQFCNVAGVRTDAPVEPVDKQAMTVLDEPIVNSSMSDRIR